MLSACPPRWSPGRPATGRGCACLCRARPSKPARQPRPHSTRASCRPGTTPQRARRTCSFARRHRGSGEGGFLRGGGLVPL